MKPFFFPSSLFLPLRHLYHLQFSQTFIYYGIRSLLILFLTSRLLLSNSQAISIYGNILAFLYISPLITGFLTDRYFCRYFSLGMGLFSTWLGTLFIILPINYSVFHGLILIIIGQGFLKPVFPLLIDEATAQPGRERTNNYITYYVTINIAATAAPLLVGFLNQLFGWNAAFFMIMAMGAAALFLANRYLNFFSLLRFYGIKGLMCLVCIGTLCFFGTSALKDPQVANRILLPFLGLTILYMGWIYKNHANQPELRQKFFFMVLFCCFAFLFEQSGSSIALFIENHTNRQMGGVVMLPTPALLSLNSLFTILVGLNWRFFQSFIKLSSYSQFCLGFLFLAAGFFLLWLASFISTAGSTGEKVHVYWILSVFFLHSMGEIAIVPLSLSLTLQSKNRDCKGVMMGLWYMAAAYSHYFAGWFASAFFKGTASHKVQGTMVSFQKVFLTSFLLALTIAITLFLVSKNMKMKDSKDGIG